MSSESSLTLAPIEPLPLSHVEEMFWRVEEHAAGAFRVAVVLRLEGYLDAALLAQSLCHLQQRHPKLRAFITRGSDQRLRFQFHQQPPPIPLEISEYCEEESSWREATRLLFQRDFSPAGPLIAVTVLRTASRGCSELLVAVHHAIADGLSAIMIVDDLLSEYARLEMKSEAPARPELSAITVKRAKPSGRWMDRLRVLRRGLRLLRAERHSEQTSLSAAADVLPQSQWVHWVFSREETLQLIRRCRKEQTSINGTLVAAVCLGLSNCLPDDRVLFKCQFPLNIREALESHQRSVTDGDLGCFVGIMNDFHRFPPRPSFWELARRSHDSLENFRKGGGPSLSYNLAEVAGHPRFVQASPRVLGSSAKRVTLLASNYGVIKLRNVYGNLRPQACTLTLNNDGTGPSLVIEALVLGQQLNIGLAGDQLDPSLWSNLQLAVRAHFQGAAEMTL